MKTKYKHIIFKPKKVVDGKLRWKICRTQPGCKRGNWGEVYYHCSCCRKGTKQWASSTFYSLSAAEHREVADFLDQLNKGGQT